MQVPADRTYTSIAANDIISKLGRATGLEYAVLARIAMMYSLKQGGREVPRSEDKRGREMRWVSVWGKDQALIRGLFCMVYGEHVQEEELFSMICFGKDHIDRGLELLWELFEHSDENPTHFLRALADEIELTGDARGAALAIDIVVGKGMISQDEVVIQLNDTTVHPNSHMAMAGKPGVGKTQLLLKILTDLREHTDYSTNFILFDYKGDIAASDRFVELSRATVYSLPNDSVPVNPFILAQYDEDSARMSAREKAESFASIDRRFGPVQKGSLTKAIRTAYGNRQGEERPYPDFLEVLQIVQADYAADGKNDDSLVEILRDLAEFKLFWDHGWPGDPLSTLVGHTVIIDVSKLAVLKELVAYLVIERLYKEMSVLPDSTVQNARREVRTVLAIDEAHNYLPQRNIFLQKIVREGRSKGIAVFFASQSPADYLQKDFDFRELLEFFFMFQCDGLSSSDIQHLVGCSKQVARQLEAEVPRLQPFDVIAKPVKGEEQVLRFKADAFYHAYE